MRYHLTPVRMAVNNKSKNKVLAKTWRKGSPCALLGRMQTGAASVESSMEILQKTKNGPAFDPAIPSV